MLENLADNLLNLRKAKGKTLREVSADVGITAAAISAYEQGSKIPVLQNLVKLAEYYGASMNALCGLPEKRNMPMKTQADALRALVMIRENVTCSRVLTEEVPFVDTPKYCDELAYVPEIDGESVTKSTFVLWETWIGRFMQDYEHLRALRESGALDQSFIDVWLEKQYSEAEKRQL